jgi:hypothetical protein
VVLGKIHISIGSRFEVTKFYMIHELQRLCCVKDRSVNPFIILNKKRLRRNSLTFNIVESCHAQNYRKNAKEFLK